MPDLIGVAECDQLSAARVHSLYRRYVGRSQVSLMTSFAFGRELVERAEGMWVHTRSGRRVLDLTGGVGVLSHGHNHPLILAARREFELERRPESGGGTRPVAALAHDLARLVPDDLALSALTNSGAEAVEAGVKLAYSYHGGRRRHILHADISFHGKLLGSGSLTGAAQNNFPFPAIPGVLTYRYDDIESVRSLVAGVAGDVYAILVEPFSASTMRHCSEGFLRALRELCTEHDIPLLFDEIYTGWGKTGSLFYFMRYPGLVPDLLTTSKSFGGGKASISALIAREPLRPAGPDLGTDLGPVFDGEVATALEAIRIAVADDYPGRAREIETMLRAGLDRVAERHPDTVAGVRGAGALFGVFLGGAPRLLRAAARFAPGGFGRDPNFATKLITCAVVDALYRDHGVYSYYTLNGRNPLVVAPSLVAEPADIEYFLTALDQTLAQGMTRLLARFVAGKLARCSRW